MASPFEELEEIITDLQVRIATLESTSWVARYISPQLDIEPGENGAGRAYCPQGWVAIGGGFEASGPEIDVWMAEPGGSGAGTAAVNEQFLTYGYNRGTATAQLQTFVVATRAEHMREIQLTSNDIPPAPDAE